MTQLDRPLKICLLSYRSNPYCGGQGVYVSHLSEAITNLGHHVEVISGPPLPDLASGIPLRHLKNLDLYNPQDLFRTPSIKELAHPLNLFEWLHMCTGGFPEPFTFGLRAYGYLSSKIKQFDVVHDNQCLSYGILALKKLFPTVVTIHHPITIDRKIAVKSAPNFYQKLKALRWYAFVGMQKKVARRFKNIITVSHSAQKEIAKEFSVAESYFRTIHNGIDTAKFYPLPSVEREKNRIMVTTSSDIPLKGLFFLLHGIKKISKKKPVKLMVIGTPKKKGVIEKTVSELNLEKIVTFTGSIPHKVLLEHYAKASVAVTPSLYEGFCFPVAEAMACGVPVISTNAGALPEVVGQAGLMVPTKNSDALASAIMRLLDNPDYAYELGQKGLKRIKEHFSWPKAGQKTVEVYKDVINDYHRF